MKILYSLVLTLLLSGCGWFGGNNQTPNNNQNGITIITEANTRSTVL